MNCGYDAEHKYGLLYQAGRKDGQDYYIGSDKKGELANGTSPEPDKYYTNWSANVLDSNNNLCPEGWRVPTFDELKSLLTSMSSDRVQAPDSEVYHSGLYGFWSYGTTTEKTGNKIFLPAGGSFDLWGNIGGRGTNGYYWSSVNPYSEYTDAPSYFYNIVIPSSAIDQATESRSAMSVRCVKE